MAQGHLRMMQEEAAEGHFKNNGKDQKGREQNPHVSVYNNSNWRRSENEIHTDG